MLTTLKRLLVLCEQLLLPLIRTNQPEVQTNRKYKHALLNKPLPWSARKKLITTKKRFKTKLFMHNTTGDVTLMNIRRETKY